jgi:hypothetical protein
MEEEALLVLFMEQVGLAERVLVEVVLPAAEVDLVPVESEVTSLVDHSR